MSRRSGPRGAPGELPATLLALAAVATAAAACGSGSGSGGPSDASASDRAVTATDAAGDLAVISCDPAAQDCPSGMKCDFYCNGATAVVGCRIDPGGGGDAGLACSGTDFCARGEGCLAVAPNPATCKKYCAADSDCPAGQCHASTVAVNCGAGTSNLALKVCY